MQLLFLRPVSSNLLIIIIKAEEKRQQLISTLKKIMIKSPKNFTPFASELSIMIGKLLTDTCPGVKEDLSYFIIVTCQNIGKDIGSHSRQIVQSLCLNLSHQHNKIRKITINVNNNN